VYIHFLIMSTSGEKMSQIGRGGLQPSDELRWNGINVKAPQVLTSTLFPGAKCPFLAWKMSLRLHFLPKGHFWKLESMLFPENFFHFREKYHISGNFFGISVKFFSYLRKNVVYPENVFCIFLDALFIRKVPLKAWPPNF
jgi:hypothetical protein